VNILHAIRNMPMCHIVTALVLITQYAIWQFAILWQL